MGRVEKEGTVLPLRRASATPGHNVSISLERISELIGAIYDCVLDPRNWDATLESINREFSFASSALGVVPLRPGSQVINVSVGADPEWIRLVADDTYRAEAVALWGGAERAQQFPIDEPILGSQSAGYADRHNNRYFRDILEPRGMIDAVLLTIAREPLLLGYVAFNRHYSGGDLGEMEVNGLRLLGPHFRRAVTISNLFEMKAIEATTFSSTLDAMSLGVILVGETLDVIHANEAAEAMLAERDALRLEKGILTLQSKAAGDALEAAVRQAASSEAAMGQKGIGIPIRRKSGEACVVHVLPLKRGDIRQGLAQRTAAAIFVAPASTPPRLPIDALTLIYDLTPAESRILELICEGATQERISDALGIAKSTVKTHLLHVFEKTGCRRQVDLVKLAASLALPV